MFLVDSFGWIEYFTDGSLADDYYKYLKKPEDIITPAIVIYEVYKKIKKIKGEDPSLIALAQIKRTKIIPIDGSASSYAEVNYIVFGIVTSDYHNELYGFLQERENLFTEKEFEDYLSSKRMKKDKDYIKALKDGKTQRYKVTPPTYIRHLIHHPENTNNKAFTRDELNQSVRFLADLKNEN